MSVGMSENNPKSKIRDQIDENLKLIYDQTLREPLPDRMLELLEKLRNKAEEQDRDGAPDIVRAKDDGRAPS
jgi:hypothetical protein